MSKRFLVKHVGNMGDLVFIVPPVLEALKQKYPSSHITLVTAWGFKEVRRRLPFFIKEDYWGHRNQSGFCIALMMTNPYVDQLIHFHTSRTALDGSLCTEDGKAIPTWSEGYYRDQKNSGAYDGIFELDFGIDVQDNPIKKAFAVCGMSGEQYSNYKLYFTKEDLRVAKAVMRDTPRPRIVLLEGIESTTTRGWDPNKVAALEQTVKKTYGTDPIWFGAKHIPKYQGKPLTLRQNIATLKFCDVAIGVLSGPMHFAAAVGLPTICLYGDHPIHRAAPAYFLNEYISDPAKQHRTIIGPTRYDDLRTLKDISVNLTEVEQKKQGYINWMNPGDQAKKSCLAAITVEEVHRVLTDMLSTGVSA